MSLSFHSRRDVETWVSEPTPGKGGAGFVAKLFTAINRAMASFANIHMMAKDETLKQCRNEFERFFLWGQGLSIVDGDLDEVLAHSKELHFRVLSLLLRLGTVVLQGLSRHSVPSSLVLAEQCDNLQTLLDTTEAMLNEPEQDEIARPYTPSESDSLEYEATEILEEISVYIDCLLDLSPSLDSPALDIQVEGSAESSTKAKESFTVSSEEALIYCRKIRDRFEILPKYLVERLAETNVLRATAIRKMRNRSIKHEVPISDNISESLFSTTDHGVTTTTKSTVPSSSTFLSSTRSKASFSEYVPVPVHEFDDNASEATFASFSTSASAVSLGRPRVPPTPEIQGDGFICLICFSRITNVKTRKEWKKHVFNDLKPYVCTIEDCKNTTLYNHSIPWAQAEASHLLSALRPLECSFCSAPYRHGGSAYFKHVSAHLREVSLAVLPQPTDDDDGFDTDDSDPSSSAPGSEQMHPATDVDKKAEIKIDQPIGETVPKSVRSPPPSPFAISSESISMSASALQAAAGSATDPEEINIDSIIDRLLGVRGSRPGTLVHLREAEIRYLCTKARDTFMSQPILLEIEAPLEVIGDIHGQYYDLLRLFEIGGFPPQANYIFLGNYVDYGNQSLETMCLILAYKIKFPGNFFPLRGNHECAWANRIFGFYDECKRRYNENLWKRFTNVFNCMPLAAIVGGKIFCMHGGLSPHLNSMEQIRRFLRPTDIPDSGILHDLLTSDPDPNITGWAVNDQTDEQMESNLFGTDVIFSFLLKHNMDLIVRGHQVVLSGYKFFANRKLVSLWSAPNWIDEYYNEYDNAGAIMGIDESLLCTFKVLKPVKMDTTN